MSSKPQKIKDQSAKKRKKSEDEEEMDEEMNTPGQKKKASRNQSSAKKKSHKRNYSSGSERGKNEKDSDDEDYDSEIDDEYGDDDDNSEMKDFIVDDEEVDDEVNDDDLKPNEGDKEKKKKRKKKMRKLDEDDIDLIRNNMGENFQARPKKLRKLHEVENDDQQDNDNRNKVKNEDSESDHMNLINPRSSILKEKQQSIRHFYSSNQYEDFDDDEPSQEKQKAKPQGKKGDQKKKIQNAKIDDDLANLDLDDGIDLMFEQNIHDDQYATKIDKIIREKDVPERLQIKLQERVNIKPSSEELQYEAKWIYDRTVAEKDNSWCQNADNVQKKIFKVLQLIRGELLDIPMITKYRKYEFCNDLTEEDIWSIFNLDLEYAKFIQEKNQIKNFIELIKNYTDEAEEYLKELEFAQNQSILNDFQKRISFWQKYYYEELMQNENYQKKKNPMKNDKIQIYKQQKLDQFAQHCFLRPHQLVTNIQHNANKFKPPVLAENDPHNIARNFLTSDTTEEKIINDVCNFTAEELATEPYIRGILKQHFKQKGYIVTNPTEKGQKELDVFHSSYKLKRINMEPIQNFLKNDDRFTDILKNVEAQLITLEISIDMNIEQEFQKDLSNLYQNHESSNQWQNVRQRVIKIFYENYLKQDIIREIKQELQQASESFIIQQCQEKFRQMLMTGPYQVNGLDEKKKRDERQRQDGQNEILIKDRERLVVMSVILHQLDNNNQQVTIAIVNKYGDLVETTNFLHLMPPRNISEKQRQQFMNEEDKSRLKKLEMNQDELRKEHSADLEKLRNLLQKYSVDLIVVGANKLETRRIYEIIVNVAVQMKDLNRNDDGYEDAKEPIVIWGSMEIPKLFSASHQSKKLLENMNPIQKQCVSLARYEQDPMAEILNLWSSSPSENQILQSNLHPLQRNVNQARLQDSLEDIAVKCVNAVGVDLNIVVNHDHLYSVLQFVSGLGPRKAQYLISGVKSIGGRVETRGAIYQNEFIKKDCYISSIAFLKIRIPDEELLNGCSSKIYDILDQTRIHQQYYGVALKVASDLVNDSSKQVDKLQQYQAIKEIIKNPDKLQVIDLNQYKQELEKANQGNMQIIIDQILEELNHPFKDPRNYRNPTYQPITPTQLLYMLIDENERTFKKGLIVTATVVRVLEDKVYCKLENGLDAQIFSSDLLGEAHQTRRNIADAIGVGHVISGRITEIKCAQKENKFLVTLKCKREDLENHKQYLDQNQLENIPESDLKNWNYQLDKKNSQKSRYTTRRIQHPKFKNFHSSQAISILKEKGEIGDFIFRPSSYGPDNLTLSWLFYNNCVVHYDIKELDKPIGATIGSKLQLGEETYENLNEIIERFIYPSTRALKEAIGHPKFCHCTSVLELENTLKRDKAEDTHRIPYRFTILDIYPAYLVIGYIPKEKLCKEYIKVKPNGFYFHQKRHSSLLQLINWFKENFKSKDYQRELKRTRSPRIKPNQPNALDNLFEEQDKQKNDTDWGGIEASWQQKPQGGNSVHSMNDDRQMIKQESRGQNEGWDGGYSNQRNYDNNHQMQDSSDQPRGRGSNRNCFNCNQPGHMSKDCPEERRQNNRGDRGGRGGRGNRGRGGFNNNEREEEKRWNNDQNDNQPSGGGWQQTNWNDNGNSSPPKNQQESSGWGDQVEQQPSKSPGGFGGQSNWGNEEQAVNQPSGGGGWGSSSPQNVVQDNEGWGGNNDNNDAAWNANNSPKDSQGGYGDREFRPRGSRGGDRGDRGGRGRGGEGRGRGGGGGACYKCQQEGHFARECPNSNQEGGRGRGGGGRDSKTCFKCQQEGHMARECPNNDQNNSRGGRGGRGRGRGDQNNSGGGRPCFKCQQEGHFARECPNDDGGRGSKPYKRQRRDDGGSNRREEYQSSNNYGQSSGGGGDQWGGGNAWDDGESNQKSNQAWNQSEGANAWNNSDQNQQMSEQNGQDSNNWNNQDQWQNNNASNEGGWAS